MQIIAKTGSYGTVELHVPGVTASGTVQVAALNTSTNRASGAVHIRYDLPGLADDTVDEPSDDIYRHRASMAAAKQVAAYEIRNWFATALGASELGLAVDDRT